MVAVGGLVLIGWGMDITVYRSLLPGQVEMKAAEALCLILLGVASALKTGKQKQPWPHMVANGAACLAVLVSVLTLAGYLGWETSVDNVLFEKPAEANDAAFPNLMSLPSALGFGLLGVAVFVIGTSQARRWMAWLVLPTAGGGVLAFVGDLYDLPWLAAFGPYEPMPAPSGIALLVLSGGILCASPSFPLISRVRGRASLMGFGGALLLLFLLAGAVLHNTRQLIVSNREVSVTYERINLLGLVLSAVQDLETGTRGYLLTGDRALLQSGSSAPVSARQDLASLRQLGAGEPGRTSRLDRLSRLIEEKVAIAARQIETRAQGDGDDVEQLAAVGAGRRAMEAIHGEVAALKAEEYRLLYERQAGLDSRTAKTLLALGTGLIASCAVLVGVFMMLRREIAARVCAADALRRSEEKLAVTLRSIGDGVLATDSDGCITLLNPVAERLTGWPQAEAQGRPVEEVFHIIHEPTRALAPNPVREVLAIGRPCVLADDTALVAREGGERSIADSAAPIRDAAGCLLGAVLVFRDVTDARRIEAHMTRLNSQLQERTAQLEVTNSELRESQATLRSLFESLPGLYLVLSPDYQIVAVSDAYLKATMTQREFIVGRGLFDVFPDNPGDPAADGVKNLRKSLDRVKARLEPHTMAIQKYDVRRPDGVFEERYWSPVNSPLIGAEGQLRYIIHRAEDVTEFMHRNASPDAQGRTADRDKLERMEAEIFQSSQQLRIMNQQLQLANEELESFSYSVSHDLRAPLRHVHGYVEMLTREAQDALSEKGCRYLRTIGEAAHEMEVLIDDLLAFARTGRAEMTESDVDLTTLVEEVRKTLEHDANGRDIRWHVGPLPRVRADGALLRQVWLNLLGNAVKYTRNRAVAEIHVGCCGEESGQAILYVRDNGAGFDMRYAARLFGVFQRLHRSEEFEGTGIGLAIVRRVIVRHGGRIWSEAKVGVGATFFFTLRPIDGLAARSDVCK